MRSDRMLYLAQCSERHFLTYFDLYIDAGSLPKTAFLDSTQFIEMSLKAAHADIKANLIRQGHIYKRSKFLKEWRLRWIVITTNFLYVFTDDKMEEISEAFELRHIKSYKSYLRKDEEMIPPGFKLRTSDDMLYFCAKNCNEKWSWIVTLERLMDFKYIGSTEYNNLDCVKTRGFDSQIEFEKGGFKLESPPVEPKPTLAEYQKKQIEKESEALAKQLQSQSRELQRRKQQIQKKQRDFEEQQRRIKAEQTRLQTMPPASQEKLPSDKIAQDHSTESRSRVAQLRSFYENRLTQENKPKANQDHSQRRLEKIEEDIQAWRCKLIQCLFEEFGCRDPSPGLRQMVNFLITITVDARMGYSALFIAEGKTNNNRHLFSGAFVQLLQTFKDFDSCSALMKFIEICISQIPGLFNASQMEAIHHSLQKILLNKNNEDDMNLVLKNMFVMHRIRKYQKEEIFAKVDKLAREAKSEETRNWARKMRDIL